MLTWPVILVVSDEKPMLKLIRANLSKKYRVVTATDAIGAVELLKEHGPGLVIFDITTPNVNSFDALTLIRQNCDTLIIALTSRNEITTLRSILAHGDKYIVKPFNIQKLLSLVEVMLKF